MDLNCISSWVSSSFSSSCTTNYTPNMYRTSTRSALRMKFFCHFFSSCNSFFLQTHNICSFNGTIGTLSLNQVFGYLIPPTINVHALHVIQTNQVTVFYALPPSHSMVNGRSLTPSSTSSWYVPADKGNLLLKPVSHSPTLFVSPDDSFKGIIHGSHVLQQSSHGSTQIPKKFHTKKKSECEVNYGRHLVRSLAPPLD